MASSSYFAEVSSVKQASSRIFFLPPLSLSSECDLKQLLTPGSKGFLFVVKIISSFMFCSICIGILTACSALVCQRLNFENRENGVITNVMD